MVAILGQIGSLHNDRKPRSYLTCNLCYHSTYNQADDKRTWKDTTKIHAHANQPYFVKACGSWMLAMAKTC